VFPLLRPLPSPDSRSLIPDSLVRRIRESVRLTILTGAGVSAASGVPTFRGTHGLWRNFRPEELATPDAFRRDPTLVWEWYAWRRQKIGRCEPNPAHHVIAGWSRNPGCTVITQNVDDLHIRAGTERLIRLHGSIWEMKCWKQCGQVPWREPCQVRTGEADKPRPTVDQLPRCPSCGGIARPAVVWFGEPLDPADVAAAREACSCDVFLIVGTSAVVYPAAGLVDEARRQGAFTVEVNPDQTPASALVDLSIRGAAEVVLPLLSPG
jgi:NAD-dependent deacetylase